MRVLTLVLSSVLLASPIVSQIAYAQSREIAAQQEKLDLNLITNLRDEALNRSKAQDYLGTLTDEIGPRLTGSPGLKRAADWARQTLQGLGLQQVRSESFAPFGIGWTYEKASVRLLSPFALDITAIPKAWTPGTQGPQKGKLMIAKITSEEDFAKWKGKLADKIILLETARILSPHLKADAQRHSHEDLQELQNFPTEATPSARGDLPTYIKNYQFQRKLLAFLSEEKVLAVLNPSRGDDGTIFVQGGGSYKKGEAMGPSNLVLVTETYNRLYRLLEKKKELEMELDIKVQLHPEDPEAAVNVLAEWPGSDKKEEVVMLGAHLDSWHGGTGATDNAAGVAISIEALRLLKEAGFKPRRTIRIALWGGEEQGLLGSRAWVKKNLAERPEPTDPKELELPSFARKPTGPLSYKPMHGKISAYYNFDNGAGKIRGIYAENNAAIKPIFEAWLKPFHDLGATTVTLRKTGSTDHVSFDSVGVPGFEFVQDRLDYFARTHHSNMDVYDKAPKEDLMQASLIMASFVAHTANRDELLPRKPLPKDPAKAATSGETSNTSK